VWRVATRLPIMAACLLGLVTGDAGPARTGAEAAASAYAFAPFGTVHVLTPTGDARGVVLVLSDSEGVSANETAIARALTQRGLLVALISTPTLMKTPETWGKHCLNANYPLVDLANDLQHRMRVRAYMKPVILGIGEGGTLAYASLAQWPNGSYQGVVSVGFAPAITSRMPWCTAPGFAARHVRGGTAWAFGPNRRMTLPWVAMHAPPEDAALRALAARVPHARSVALPPAASAWPAPVADAVLAMLPRPPARLEAGPLPMPDMPLTLVPARHGTAQRNLMAIVYSGDGGWVGIDRDVAGELAAAGIPVVGVDSLAYFWTARTPAGAGRDLAELINAFSRHWRRPRVLLVGYSFGADALPSIIGQLDAATRAKIAQVSLLGLSTTADFQFHLSSWLNISADNGLPTVPAASRLRGMALQCVRGEDEDDSACPLLPPGLAQQFLVPGGHHFNRNAALLAQIILDRRAPGTVSD